jgi:O-antigen/teichoic acid export membrane protein
VTPLEASGRASGTQPAAPARLRQAAETDKRLISRSSVTFVARAFAKFSQIIFLVVAARLLPVDEFASYSYLLTLAAAFTVLSDTGVPLVTSRDISAGRATPGALFWAGAPVVAASALLAAVALPIFGLVDSGPGSSLVPVAVTAAFVLFNRAFDFIGTTLRGLGHFNLVAGIEAAGAVALLVGGIAVTVADLGVTAVLTVFALKELVSALIGFLALRPELPRPRRGEEALSWRPLLRIGIHLAAAGIALSLVMRVPLAVLGNTGSTREVALFSAAQRFGDAGVLLASTTGLALLPGISLLARTDPARAKRLFHRTLLALMVVSAVIALLALPVAEQVMRAIFGDDYADGATLLRIIALGVPAYLMLGLCWYGLVAFGRERRLLRIGLLGIVVTAAFAIGVIPSAGDEGAAWAYITAIYAMALASVTTLERTLAHSGSADTSGDPAARPLEAPAA